jgi:hypothetical protein
VRIRRRDVPEWQSRHHRVRRHISGGRVLYIPSK